MKTLKYLLAAILVGGCVAIGVCFAPRSDRAVQALAISVLRDVPASFLVLESTEQYAMATISDGGWIMGPRAGQVVARRKTFWGVDLTRVGPDHIEVAGNLVCVQLPPPSVLDIALDLSSLQFITKRSGIQLLGDLAMGRSLERDLLALIYHDTPAPTADEIQARRLEFVGRLNRDAVRLFESKGLAVRFE